MALEEAENAAEGSAPSLSAIATAAEFRRRGRPEAGEERCSRLVNLTEKVTDERPPLHSLSLHNTTGVGR